MAITRKKCEDTISELVGTKEMEKYVGYYKLITLLDILKKKIYLVALKFSF